ncbi:MAG TPA: hypothetical protein VF698_15870 [Thermoanaerobaculia bacterium]
MAADQLLFGLAVRASRAIPFAASLPQPRAADVLIHCGSFPDLTLTDSTAIHDVDEPSLRFTFGRTASGTFVFDYPDAARFAVSANEIAFDWREPLTFEDACTYLLGPVFAFVLRLRGASCVHASAVAIGGKAVLLAGATAAGKSTLAAALVQRGCVLVAEDVVPIAGAHAIPTYPAIRLWPRSVELLFGDRDALPRISPSWDKRIFVVDAFARAPVPIDAIYFPEAGFGETRSSLFDVTPHDSAITLIGHTYRGEILDGAMRRRDFDVLGKLAAELPSRAIVVGRGREELLRAADLFIEDVQRHV